MNADGLEDLYVDGLAKEEEGRPMILKATLYVWAAVFFIAPVIIVPYSNILFPWGFLLGIIGGVAGYSTYKIARDM